MKEQTGLNRFRRRSIARDLTLTLVLSTTTIFLAISAFSYIYFSTQSQNTLTAQAIELADNLAEVMAVPLWDVNDTAVSQIAAAYEAANNVVAVNVFDETGTAVYQTPRPALQGNTFSETRPVVFSDTTIGRVEITFSNRDLEETRRWILFVSLAAFLPVVLTLIIGTSALVNRFVVRPLNTLTNGIETIADGEYNFRLPPMPQQDIQFIANRANVMAEQIEQRDATLHELINNLEGNVSDRTRDLALAAEVGRRISQVRDLQTMLTDAVESICDRFDLYLAQIYLANTEQQQLILHASTGEIGRQLLDMGHKLAIGPGSLNGRAALEKQTIHVPDTTVDENFLHHPLLPDTRSETVIPLMSGERVLGVLDLQSSTPYGLSRENLPAFEALGGQLAIAINNAELFAELRQTQAEMEKFKLGLERTANAVFLTDVNGIIQYVNTAFVSMYGYAADEAIGKTPRILKSGRTPQGEYAEYWRALLNREVVTGEIINKTKDGRFVEIERYNSPIIDEAGELVGFLSVHNDITARKAAESRLARSLAELDCLNDIGRKSEEQPAIADFLQWVTQRIPAAMQYAKQCVAAITFADNTYGYQEILDLPRQMVEGLHMGNKQVGRLYVAYTDTSLQFADDDSAFMGALGRRINGYLETHQLLQQLSQRADELQRVAEVGTAVSTISDPQQLLQTFVDLTKTQFALYHAQIYLHDKQTDYLVLAAGAGQIGQSMVSERRQIFMHQQQSLVAQAARSRQGVTVNDVHAEPGFLPHPLLPDTHAEVAIPLIAGEQLLGVLDLQADQANAFSSEDISLFTTLSTQAAVALQNANQLEQTQSALEELTALQRTITREGWQAFMSAKERPVKGYLASAQKVKPISEKAQDEETPALTQLKKTEQTVVNAVSIGGAIIGGLGVRPTADQKLTDADQTLLEAISQQVGQALERARLAEQTQLALDETQQRTQELAVLNEMSQTLTAQTSVEDVLEVVYTYTSRLMDAAHFYIVLYDERD
ncbi:MAG: GAF domain-containing protein [Chloroflexota bacterium]